MTQPRLKHFGWGREGEGLTPDEEAFVLGRIEQRFGSLVEGEVKPPELDDLKLESPRINAPASLPFCSTALYDCAAHTYGPDYVRGLGGDYSNAPDVVAYPRTEEDRGSSRLGRQRAGECVSVRRGVKCRGRS
jgi:alkyldihydroxyacetonephosphate synthase